MENQTAVTRLRVPSPRRSQRLTNAAWITEFVREYFADAILYGRSDLSCHLLEQARPFVARIKLLAKNKKMKSRPLSIACAGCQTHK